MMMYRMMGGSWGSWDSMPEYMQDMMQKYSGGAKPFWAFAGLMEFIVWILVIALLVAAIRYLWILGNKK